MSSRFFFIKLDPTNYKSYSRQSVPVSLLEVHVDIITYIGYRIRIQYMYSAAERLLSYHFITYTQENVSIAKS